MSSFSLELNMQRPIHNKLMCLPPIVTLCRGEKVRPLQLPDIFYLKLEGEGYSVCYAIVAVMSQGKKKTVYGRKAIGSFIDNKNVVIFPWIHQCPTCECYYGNRAVYNYCSAHARKKLRNMIHAEIWKEISLETDTRRESSSYGVFANILKKNPVHLAYNKQA